MGSSDTEIKTLLEAGLKKKHGTDLSEFVELFYVKSVCNCEPNLRSRKKTAYGKILFHSSAGLLRNKNPFNVHF